MSKNINKTRVTLVSAVILLLITWTGCRPPKSDFEVKDNAFQLNGKPLRLICGEMHYPRIPQEYWRDRMRRAKAMGINTLSTYVFWNIHERQPGVFDFTGQADLARFIGTAHEEGLYVILRPGPYVCAEWDFGGYPAWLQMGGKMAFRSCDPAFLTACNRYIDRLGKELAPLTVSNGGPILMVQVENEYGSYSDDKLYLGKLRDMIRRAGFNVPLFTNDIPKQLEFGTIDGVLPAVTAIDGIDVKPAIDRYQQGGPYFVAEFYPAWFDTWGLPHHKRDHSQPAEQLDQMLADGLSVSIYMLHGGTNFEYTNGANSTFGYAPQPTSYDYDAPISESGQCTPKYLAFREAISRHLPVGETLPDIPADNPVVIIPTIQLEQSAPLSAAFTSRIAAGAPLTMEDVGQDFGYIHYETVIETPIHGILRLKDLRDYAVITLNGRQIGSLDRRLRQNSLPISITEVPARLEILVENAGRVNYGIDILNNRKGITSKVLIDDREITGWTVSPLPLYCTDVHRFDWNTTAIHHRPAFFRGTFRLSKTGDTFIDLRGWGKGAVWVNGHSLGKYWNIGPQQTLYLPGPWLKSGENEIIVFEMEDTGCRTLAGLDHPILDDLRTDRNIIARPVEHNGKQPVIDASERIYGGQLKRVAGRQIIRLPQKASLRYLCLEVTESYDGVNASLSELDLLGSNGKLLPKEDWRIVYTNTEQIGEGEADHLIDGSRTTYWHSQWQNNPLPFPHRIIIDLGREYAVGGFQISQRHPDMAGCVKAFNLYGRTLPFSFHK